METELDQAALLKQIEIKRLESISNLGNLDKLRKSEIQTVPALVKNLLGILVATSQCNANSWKSATINLCLHPEHHLRS